MIKTNRLWSYWYISSGGVLIQNSNGVSMTNIGWDRINLPTVRWVGPTPFLGCRRGWLGADGVVGLSQDYIFMLWTYWTCLRQLVYNKYLLKRSPVDVITRYADTGMISSTLNWSPLDKIASNLADDDLKCIFVNGNFYFDFRVSLKFIPSVPIDNRLVLSKVITPEPTLTQ